MKHQVLDELRLVSATPQEPTTISNTEIDIDIGIDIDLNGMCEHRALCKSGLASGQPSRTL